MPVRVAHWLIALSIVVLSVTGPLHRAPVHHRRRARPASQFVMGWMKVIHGYAAYRVHHGGAACASSGCSPATDTRAGTSSSRCTRRGARDPADGLVLLVRSAQASGIRWPQPGGRLRLSRWCSGCIFAGHRDRARDATRRAPTSARRCDGSRRSRRSSAACRSRAGFTTWSCGCCSASRCITSTARC